MRLGIKSKRGVENKVCNQPGTVRLVFPALVLWLVAVGAGFGILSRYENTAGVSARPPAVWSTESLFPRDENHWSLVMLVHPHCPCSRAAISELSLIMAQSEGRLTANVLFLRGPDASKDWEKTDLWEDAASIPGVNVLVDEGGKGALLFNAATSGQTMLYDSEGRLRFSGGITISRGHSGDNVGRSAIVSMVNGGTSDQAQTLVFGCPLFDESSECRKTQYDNNKN